MIGAMGRVARLAWILLGLLAVFGVIHAPLHGDGAPCSPAALCSGALSVLCAGAFVFLLLLALSGRRSLAAARGARRHPAFLVERGRAPPRG